MNKNRVENPLNFNRNRHHKWILFRRRLESDDIVNADDSRRHLILHKKNQRPFKDPVTRFRARRRDPRRDPQNVTCSLLLQGIFSIEYLQIAARDTAYDRPPTRSHECVICRFGKIKFEIKYTLRRVIPPPCCRVPE